MNVLPWSRWVVFFQLCFMLLPGCSLSLAVRSQSLLHCRLENSAVSLLSLEAGWLLPCLPAAACHSICVSPGQKITHVSTDGAVREGLVRSCQEEMSQTFLHPKQAAAGGAVGNSAGGGFVPLGSLLQTSKPWTGRCQQSRI